MGLFLMCSKVFFARIIDVCLGAFRTVNIVRGNRVIATVIAFFEVLIWYAIAREVLTPKTVSLYIPLSYAAGYATGTFLGTFLSTRLIKGYFTIYIISNAITKKDLKIIKNQGFGVSTLNTIDNKMMLIIEIDKRRLDKLREIIKNLDQDAFMIINETKYINNGFIK